VLIACVFIGAGLLYWLYKSKQGGKEEKRKREESEKGPGMPELGERLRYELEPGTKMATPSENIKESCVGRYTASTEILA
jgi:hypothetical protein